MFVHSECYIVSFIIVSTAPLMIYPGRYRVAVLGEHDKKYPVLYFQWIQVLVGIIWSLNIKWVKVYKTRVTVTG